MATIKENISNALSWFWGKLKSDYLGDLTKTDLPNPSGTIATNLSSLNSGKLDKSGGSLTGDLAFANEQAFNDKSGVHGRAINMYDVDGENIGSMYPHFNPNGDTDLIIYSGKGVCGINQCAIDEGVYLRNYRCYLYTNDNGELMLKSYSGDAYQYNTYWRFGNDGQIYFNEANVNNYGSTLPTTNLVPGRVFYLV